jgi:hypothetical protein
VFELAGRLAGAVGGGPPPANTQAAPASTAVNQPIPEPTRTTVVPAEKWAKNGKSQWKDTTDPTKITTTTDANGDVRAVKFDANLVLDDDGTKQNVVGLKFYESAKAKATTALKKEHPDWDKAKLDTESKKQAKEDAVAEAAKKTKETGQNWTVDVDYRSDIATIHGEQLNANKIPFVALPKQIRELSDPPIKHGDLVAVTYKGKTVYAIYGDGGPDWKAGEGSPALAKKLGLGGGYNDAEAKKSGDYVTYTILPGSAGQLPAGPLSYDSVQQGGRDAFAKGQKDGVIAP